MPRLLRLLSRSYTLAVLSNLLLAHDGDVRLALSHTGLMRFFRVVHTSESLGISKPDPNAFWAVLEVLGATPSEALMIGDEWEADILGAYNAGMGAIWFVPPATLLPQPLAHIVHITNNPSTIARVLAPTFAPGGARPPA